MTQERKRADRRSAIAEAGISIVASRGVRSLTHRAIDTELRLPTGSTSYYARTRKDLVVLIVERLADRTTTDLRLVEVPETLAPNAAAKLIIRGLSSSVQRSDDQMARIALHLEYRHDEEIRRVLEGDPPVRPMLLQLAEQCLTALGVEEAQGNAPDLVALLDGLLMQKVVRGGEVDTERMLRNYLTGVVDSNVTQGHH